MSMPSPYEVALGIGNKLGQGFKAREEQNLIDRVLSDAMQANDPMQLQGSIAQILANVRPENQQGALQYLQNSMANMQQRKEEAQLEKLGVPRGTPKNLQADVYKQGQKNQALGNFFGMQQGQQQMGQSGQMGQMQPVEEITEKETFDWSNVPNEKLLQATGSPYREISEPAKAEQTRRIADEKLKAKSEEASRKETIEFHKESEKYDDELFKSAKSAKQQLLAIKDIDKAVESGNVNPKSVSNFFKGLGVFGDKIAEAFLSGDQAKITASIPYLLEGWKDVFGVRLTDADLKLLQDKLPSIGKSPEANKVITNILRKYGEMTQLRQKIANNIKKENKGLRPLGYRDMVENRFEEMTAPVKILNPKTGNVIEIPAYQVSNAISAGAKLANE